MSGKLDKIDRIFWEASQRTSSDERKAYLDSACGEDRDLRLRVEKLLNAQPKAERFLEQPFGGDVAPTLDMPIAVEEKPGMMIGRYKLVHEIGHGGMGVVYMAVQKEPVKRKVALKIIKPGMDTREVVTRFEAERQALALMDHPCIATVLDGGSTESGRPYFVMELVVGAPITEYCDECRYTTRQRLELFTQVCQAVQHAHQKGVIHRDIKPSNILVTTNDDKAVPKVIDFGIAKALHQQLSDQSVYTHTTQMIGTPLYMSPEQTQRTGVDVDTRTDVYSLGVMLYELLTGTTPFDKERLHSCGVDEFKRIVREEEPSKPSTRLSTVDAALETVADKHSTDLRTLKRELSGELDWIVLKALEKDRTRRYESASDFAKDVQRHLDDEAVEACPPSTAYRLRKFARRHKAQLVTLAAIAAVLVMATLVSSGLAAWAVREKGIAGENLMVAKRNEAAANRERAAALDARKIAEQQEKLAQQQRDAAEYDLYVSNMHLARHDWLAGQGGRLFNLLDALVPKPERPDYRGWEWYYLFSQVHSERFALPRQRAPIACSPDGKSLATCDQTGLIKIWDMGNEEPKASLKGCPGRINWIAWSPVGERLAAAGDRKIIVIWDLASGHKVQSLRGHAASVHRVDWNPDGVRLASLAADGTVGIWDWRSGKTLSWLRGLKRGQYSLAWLPDGRRLLGCGGTWDSNALIVWNTETGEEVVSRHARNAVLSPDGSRIAVVGDGGRVEAMQTGELIASFGDSTLGNIGAWSPDGERFASCGMPIKIWDAETGAEISSILTPARVWPIVWSPAGPLLAGACADGAVRVWEAACAQQALTVSTGSRHALSVAFSPDGRRLLVGARFGMLKMVEPGKPTLSMQQPRGTYNWSVAWSPRGDRFACRYGNGAMIYDANTGEVVLPLQECEETSGSVAWSPDGNSLAVAYYRPENRKRSHVRLWDVSTGREVAKSRTTGGHPDDGPRLAWSPDGTRLAGGKCVWAWDSASRELREEVVLPTTTEIVSVGWSPDSKSLAVGEHYRITIYDTTDWAQLRVLLGHTSVVNYVAWHPHMTRLASGGRDGTIRIWDSSTGRELWASDAHGTGDVAVAWSPDGWRLASAGMDCEVRIWDASAAVRFLDRQGRESDTQSQAAKWDDATRLARKGQLDEAIARFNELSAETPDLPDYRLRLPSVLFDAGRQEEAIQMLQRSIGQFPDRREYQDELAFLYERRATQLCEAGQFEEATSMLRTLAEEFPDRPDFRAELGFQMAKAERLEETMAVFEKLSDALEGRPDFRPELARQLAANRMHILAATIYGQLVDEYPGAPEYRGLHNAESACGLLASGRVGEVIAILRKLVDEFPDLSEYRSELGNAYARRAAAHMKNGELEEAIADSTEASRFEPGEWGHCNNVARFLVTLPGYETRDASRAVELARKAVNLSPQWMCWNTLAVAQYRAGQWKAAIESLDKSMELGETVTDWFFLAMAHWRLGHKDEARQWYRKAVEWTEKNKCDDEELRLFRNEAAELLGMGENDE
jgi:WD40 repeat protein/tRNA A-37 threonylcarbamoyl transferase component Bud32/Tfp pilus assembly protein PilF